MAFFCCRQLDIALTADPFYMGRNSCHYIYINIYIQLYQSGVFLIYTPLCQQQSADQTAQARTTTFQDWNVLVLSIHTDWSPVVYWRKIVIHTPSCRTLPYSMVQRLCKYNISKICSYIFDKIFKNIGIKLAYFHYFMYMFVNVSSFWCKFSGSGSRWRRQSRAGSETLCSIYVW